MNLQMALSLEEIRNEINNPRKKSVINRAILHQNRIKFHVQTRLTPNFYQPVYDFFAFVENLLTEDKFKMFTTLFRYPVATNEVTAICFDKLSRVFEGRNPVFNYQFMNSAQRDDWEWYRTDVLKEPEVWATRGFEFFKTEINSILIVDMSREQNSEKPMPYFYWLPISHVISYELHRDGAFDWIIFKQDDDKIVCIDEQSYRVFRSDKSNKIGEQLADNPHDLGYCPARFFWSESITIEEPDIKASPITKQLEALDWYLFYIISKRHLDLYGSYPIYSGYEQDDKFSNELQGDKDNGGYLLDEKREYVFDTAGIPKMALQKQKKRIIGAGSFVEVPIPIEGQPDLRNPVQMLTVDRNSLDYNVAELTRLRTDIITAVVGTNEEITTRDALNEQQILANFESQSTVLNRVKRGFEQAQTFVDETVCRLRYGNDFVSLNVNYGTDFFLYDADELRKRYKTAKESGSSEAELDALQRKIIETEYRTDPVQLQRMLMMQDLEPYRHLTRDEVIQLYKDGIITETDMRIKLNFSNLVSRFERENLNITEFGIEQPYQKRIEIINQKFKEYVSKV